MSRYTITTLRDDVDKINDWASSDGLLVRLVINGRNGYQAIDEYNVGAEGVRDGGHVNRNVEAGSSRDCGAAAYRWYSECLRSRERAGRELTAE